MEIVVSSSNGKSIDDVANEQEHETSQTTSTLISAADNFCENLSRKKSTSFIGLEVFQLPEG